MKDIVKSVLPLAIFFASLGEFAYLYTSFQLVRYVVVTLLVILGLFIFGILIYSLIEKLKSRREQVDDQGVRK